MKQKHGSRAQPMQASERKKLEHALANIEVDKIEPGFARRSLPDRDRHKPVMVEGDKVSSVVPIEADIYPLYRRLASLIDTLLDAVKQPDEKGTYNVNTVEELSFQWHRGRLRAEREHGTPE